ncbi:MAG: hypothetical protein ABFD91_03080 [Anaerohalosphaeraceae bacterium]
MWIVPLFSMSGLLSHKSGGDATIFILILLEIFRFGAAKELSAASFQHQLYHRGYAG